MKHLLQNTWTGKYFAYGKWTRRIAEAESFPHALSAIETSIRNKLRHVDLVLMLGSEPSAADDIRVPLAAH